MFSPMFVPPRHHEGLFRFAETFVPHLGRFFGNVHGIAVAPESLERMRAIGNGRALICPNHPTETDPIVVFWLAALVRNRFNFLSTRETLDGPRGWLLNRIGVYSIIRGYPDRESLRMTRTLLAEQDRRVVIFPEGLVYEHNDRLLAFESGVAQMGFWALDDLEKAGKSPQLPLYPVSIKYRCTVPPEPYLERGLEALERRLGVPKEGGYYPRLLRISERVLAGIEATEGLKADSALDLTGRIQRARQAVIRRVARASGAEIDETETPGSQLHALTNHLRAWVGVLPEQVDDYAEQLHERRAATAAPLFADLRRLHNFVGLTGDYIISDPSAERFLEVLGRLQHEVLGKVQHTTPLAAHVRVAAPIRLEEHRDAYRSNKRETVREVTRETEAAIRAGLREMSAERTPLDLQQ